MAWNDLSISQKSHLMNIFRGQGVYSLSEMKQIYDSMYPSVGQDEWGGNVPPVFDEGGEEDTIEGGTLEPSVIRAKKPWKLRMKDLAYRIGSENKGGVGVSVPKIIKSLIKTRKGNTVEYDELKNFLYGPSRSGFVRSNSPHHGPTFDKEYPEYEGRINALDTLYLPDDYKALMEELAKRNTNIYLNADVQHTDIEDLDRYDAENYPMKLRIGTDGNIVGDAADVYDFGKHYMDTHRTGDWYNDFLVGLEANLMQKVGTPYVVRHNNIPVKFVSKEDQNYDRAHHTIEAWNRGETGFVKGYYGAEDNALKRAGIGPVKGASIEAAQRTQETYDPYLDTGEDITLFKDGGKIHIKKSKRGTFTAAAKKHGMGVQAFARKVLANPDEYSPAMRKKANFARNASRWKAEGGDLKLTPALDEALSLL